MLNADFIDWSHVINTERGAWPTWARFRTLIRRVTSPHRFEGIKIIMTTISSEFHVLWCKRHTMAYPNPFWSRRALACSMKNRECHMPDVLFTMVCICILYSDIFFLNEIPAHSLIQEESRTHLQSCRSWMKYKWQATLMRAFIFFIFLLSSVHCAHQRNWIKWMRLSFPFRKFTREIRNFLKMFISNEFQLIKFVMTPTSIQRCELVVIWSQGQKK